MRIFVTGATGWVGSAVVKELTDAGHKVLGLARSDDGAKALAAAGADVHRGRLDDLESLKSGAAACDGVIHTAFGHDFSKFQQNAEIDRQAIEAMGDVLAGSDRPLVTTSGTLMVAMVAPGRLGTEADEPPAAVPRVPSEVATLALASRGVRSSVIRLPPSVHDSGDQGFMPRIIDIARETGVAAYIGDGRNRWPAVHKLDAARAYRLALESGKAGSRYHVVGDEGIPIQDIAHVVGRRLNLPTRSITAQEASSHFGFLSMFLGLDAPASSEITRKVLDWTPTHRGLIEDLEEGAYFDNASSKYSGG